VLVTAPDEIAALAADLARAPLVAFDLEFVSSDRRVPLLCLVQVAWLEAEGAMLDAPAGAIVARDPEVRLVDALADDITPLVHALAAHPHVVAHAPRQDLGLLATRFGVELPGLVDTQLMAAFAGLGDQIGLAALAGELLGLSLGKELQWTDWQRRPLSDAQLAYAASDVRHLPALYAQLATRLGPRLAWARAETAQIQADAVAAANVTAETAWREVGGTRGLDAAAHAALVALAAWRHRLADELDRPLGHVLADKALVELARIRPKDVGGVRALKGLSPIAKTRAAEVVASLAAAPPAPVAVRPAWRAPSVRAQRWAELLLAIVHVLSAQTGIAPRLLATRADAEELARTVDEHGLAGAAHLPAFSTWRAELLGAAWQAFLTGNLTIAGDLTLPHGVHLIRAEVDRA
jgi:ribonuclease D